MENITSKGTIFGTLIAQAGPKGDTGKTGDRGLTGEAGYSPIKGVDYFTQEDISEIRKGIEGDLTGEYNKNAIEKTNIFNTNAKETTTSFDLNAENKTKEYNDNALAEIEKYNSNAIEKSNNFDTNFENKTSKFDSNCDEKTKEFNDNNDLGIQNYNNNAKKQMEIFDTNFTEKLEAFNNNAGNKFNGFNTNSDKALAEYNKNHTAKIKEFDDNATAKLTAYNKNNTDKTNAYNANDIAKTKAYNDNTVAKEKSYNDNATSKTERFDSNATNKQKEFDDNANDKLAEYNQNAEELINKVEQVQTENESLKAENKLIKEQIPSASASGNSVHIEDSGTLDFDWKINGGHAQAITTQPENYVDDREARGKTILEATSLYLPIMNLKAGNGYYFKIFDKDNQILQDSRYLAVDFYDENKVKIGSGPLGFPHNFTEEVATKVKYAKIYYNSSDKDKVIGNTVIKKIGLKITSSVSADDIDMFVPDSPSPDYPSEVETVGSIVNELKLKNGKSIKAHGLDVSIDNGIITINGTANEYYPTFLISGDGEIETRSGRPSINANPNWYNSITLTERDYTLKFEYISGDDGTAYRPYVFIHTSDGKNSEFSQGNSTKIKNYTGEIAGISFYVDKNQTFNNYKFRVYVVKGTYTKDTIPPYSSYGMGSVEIDVVNKNLYNGKNEIGGINNDGSLNNNADRWRAIDYINVENSTDISINIYNITTTGALGKYCLYDKNYNFLSSTQIININTVVNVSNVSYFRFWFLNDKVPTNTKIQVKTGSTPTTYAQQQSQTAIMPIQQEMLEGDYVADVEHHEWKKLVLAGDEDFEIATSSNGFNAFLNRKIISDNSLEDITTYCNNFKSAADINFNLMEDNTIFGGRGYQHQLLIRCDKYTTIEDFKAMLKSKYEAGTPVIIYYKLATPVDLELTSEQKAVREQKLYTYKNITNISLSDELASIDVNYKKDPTTEHDELQNQIDEIKQLISTTETSALLLDNLQKDVESEVE